MIPLRRRVPDTLRKRGDTSAQRGCCLPYERRVVPLRREGAVPHEEKGSSSAQRGCCPSWKRVGTSAHRAASSSRSRLKSG